jgi:hypothetical protein
MENNKISGIFTKKKKEKNENKKNIERKILSKQEILSSIPQDALFCENTNLQSTKTEYRWRILNIKNIENEIIEISIKSQNSHRLFLNQNGEWVENNNCNYYDYDKYVTKSYYYYE